MHGIHRLEKDTVYRMVHVQSCTRNLTLMVDCLVRALHGFSSEAESVTKHLGSYR